jgi:hypothetical protein
MVNDPQQGRRSNPPADDDAAMRTYLSRIRLDELDLGHIELESSEANPLGLSLRLFGLVLMLVLSFALPSSGIYQLNPSLHGLVYATACAALAFAISLWPWARQWIHSPAVHTDAGFAERVAGGLERLLAQIPPVWRRGLMLLCFLSLGATVLLALPRDAQWQGGGYANNWFVSVGLALTCGIVGGRWLIAHAEAARARATDSPIISWQFPPWFKWVTLSGLVAGAAYASFGSQLLGGEGDNFSLTGVGFAVGIGSAIWIARRFDEWEVDWQQGRRRR